MMRFFQIQGYKDDLLLSYESELGHKKPTETADVMLFYPTMSSI